jgi:predicted O-methyltransferase YrrM
MSTLLNAPVAGLLEQLFAEGAREDARVLPNAIAQMRNLGGPNNDRLIGHLLEEAYISVSPEVGRLLYQIARIKRPGLIVEFGTSFAISTIHLGAAVRDNGVGRVVTTELSALKTKRALEHLKAAGLRDLVELRQGDAFETLARDAEPIDMLLLDGWKELYLPLLKMLEPRLQPGAIIVADDLRVMPEMLAPYLAHVRDASNRYISVEIPMDDGLEVSLKI